MKEENTELLKYDSDNHCFTRYSSKLGDMYTKIRQVNCWDLEDIIPEFDPKYMKLVEELFRDKDRGKIQSKKIKSNEDAELIKIIFNLLPKPKENKFKCNIKFKEDEPKSLNIDYYCLSSIVVIIMYILDSIIHEDNYPQFLSEVLLDNFSKVIDISLWGSSLIKFKQAFNEVESLSFDLSTSHDDNIDINHAILFSYFFPVLFPKVNNVKINLNESKIIYNINNNPYKIRECDVVDFCKKYKNLFISNFIIINLISNIENLLALKITMAESFINEINYIFNKEFEKSHFKDFISKKLSLIYFRKLMFIKTVQKLSLIINSLDTFLFKESINLIALYSKTTDKLKLQLFSEPEYFNIRKIYLNYLTAQDFHETDPNIVEKHQIIMYPYIENLEEQNLPLIEEEKIPDLLFPQFKNNINKLKLILSASSKIYKFFYLDISPYEELSKYDNYNIEILLFIYDVLSALKESTSLKALTLKCLNINYSSVLQIKKNINKLISGELVNLSGCQQLESISLNMAGISLYLDFNKLPPDNLRKISIEISTLRDMKEFNEALKNLKERLLKLAEIKLFLALNEDDKIFEEFLNIYDNIPSNVDIFKLTIENTIGKSELIKIIKGVYKNINIKKEKIANYILYCNSKELEAYLHEIKINNLKEYFMSNNVPFVGKCKYNGEQNRRISLTLIKSPQIETIKPILLCINKITNNSEINKILCSKIFRYMGKAQNFIINLN